LVSKILPAKEKKVEISRKELKRQRREEERRHKQQQRILRTAGIIVAVVILIGGAVFLISRASQADASLPGTPVADEGRNHIPDTQQPQYNHYPPASGPHYDAPANWGIYDQPLPEGRWVHNLEHGGIVILYKCPSGCPDLVKQLRDFYASAPQSAQWHEVKLVITPYDKMDHQLGIVAWDWIDEMDNFDSARLLKFYKAHLDQGPEDVP
jgi:hypothetical protein